MPSSSDAPAVSVLMPTWNRALFLPRAIESLRSQTLENWELLIIDDGSTDSTAEVVQPYLLDARVRYLMLERNLGLGAALNHGLGQARGQWIAYLPSDDVFYEDHLQSLFTALGENRQAVLAYSGVRHHYNREAAGSVEGYSLQLVQVMHRAGDARWTEREKLVSDDLGRLFWDRLRPLGEFVSTGRVSCEWVDHPDQLHKLVREPEGGINLFRVRFAITHPLRFHTTVGNLIDEVEQYRAFRERPDTPMASDGLKILLVGELAYNADRVLALEERGHKL